MGTRTLSNMAMMRLCALSLLASCVFTQTEQPPQTSGFGNLLSRILQNSEQGAGPPPQFEIEIEFQDGAPPTVHRHIGGKGGKGGIFGLMMERMQHMRQRMQQRMPVVERPEDQKSPFQRLIHHEVRRKMKKQHKKLTLACAEEIQTCPSQHGKNMIDCLFSESAGEMSEACGDQFHHMKSNHREHVRRIQNKHSRLLERMQQVCKTELQQLCAPADESRVFLSPAALDEQLVCLVKHKTEISSESSCDHLVQKTASRWGRFEAMSARRAQIQSLLAQNCVAEMVGCNQGCPFMRLKCLQKQPSLSADCSATVTQEVASMKAQKKAHKRLKKAHKACKKTFHHAASDCGSDNLECVTLAKAAKRSCHRGVASQNPVHAVLTAPRTVTYRHQVITSPGDHCLEITISGGNNSPFWKSEGWKYSAPDRPEWITGQCDSSKWKSVDETTNDYDGYTSVKNSPYSSVFLIKYGLDGSVVRNAKQPVDVVFDQVQSRSKPPNNYTYYSERLQSDKQLQLGLGAMLVFLLAGVVFLSVSRRTDGTALELELESIKSGSSHDQL